ncbi:aldo/keto reductase [Microterricola viridarii]|uniref:Predicted oxidoreductase n=1 Tax=Microterricola viridarii TaxID=412690 RepID=A0A1H1X411_9MICO|nr:aldo/keto reductase [Microterricola viridarii]SDT03800.1 Predicted oxidoreductase [Microterricola viridarii]
MAQFVRVGARKRQDEETTARSGGHPEGTEHSPHSGEISGLAQIPELGTRTADPEPDPRAPTGTESPAEAHGAATAALLPLPDAMRRRVADTDLDVFPLALGTSMFGWTLGATAAEAVLDRYRESGGNFIDTADSYAAGRSEQLIGSWLRRTGGRDATVLCTKIGRNPENLGLGATGIIRAVEASLKRLQTDHIDLLTFHLDDRDVHLEESLSAVDSLIRAGAVRYLAASNFTAERLLEARVLAANGLPRFRVLQSHYNLMHRAEYETSLALLARAQGLAVMPYFALANGFLAGGYRSRSMIAPDVRGMRIASHLTRRGTRILTVMDRIAEDFDVKLATVALAWLQSKRSICAPVAGVSSPEQLDAVMAAATFRLSRADIIDLDRATAGN